ncbi:MAG: hypothetical protein QM749_14010 [Aquabacterium sp.]
MAFAFETAYIGPYAVTLAKAQSGDTQTFRFKVPAPKDELAKGAFMLKGQIRTDWSTARQAGPVLEAGALLNGDRADHAPPMLCLNEALTLTALLDSAYVSASAVGIEERVVISRLSLRPDERLTVPRYNLLMVPAGSVLSVNGAPAVEGPRLVYARSGELVVEAHTACHLGVCSLQA